MDKTFKNVLRGLAAAAVPVVITAGGWWAGGGALEALDDQGARVAYLLLSIAAFFSAPFAAARVKNLASKGSSHDKRQDKFIIITSAVSGVLMIISPLSDGAGVAVLPGGTILRWFGFGLYALGFLLMVIAPLYLGRQFSAYVTLQEDHQLITTGPFAVLRHPRYAGCVYWGLGLPLVFASLPGLVVGIIYGALFLWRIHDEEQLLERHFQNEWRAYAGRTKRLLPYVY